MIHSYVPILFYFILDICLIDLYMFCRSMYEVEQYRHCKEITVKGNSVPYPIQYFEEGTFPDYCMNEVRYVVIMLLTNPA
jgi:hypothetical protein